MSPSCKPTITLLPAEQLFRELLLDCRDQLPDKDLRIWFTGGWVRDRLLGIPSTDLDVALSSMTGAQFGASLSDLASQKQPFYRQRAKDLGIEFGRFTRFHTIKKNPSKGKNLESATGKAFGLDVDFVNLRTEDRDGLKFGSAEEEDAFRRDATINALFYDLITCKVMDYTKQGLEDLLAGIMRTPLSPQETFLDDPLRVLRLIRIGSKLGFRIETEAMSWMKSDEVHMAFTQKVSRARIGVEILRMAKCPSPEKALGLIYRAGLFGTVFLQTASPLYKQLHHAIPNEGSEEPWPSTWTRVVTTFSSLWRDTSSVLGQLAQSEDDKEMLWVLVAYSPLAKLDEEHFSMAAKGAMNALGSTNKFRQLLNQSLENIESIQSAAASVASDIPPPRHALGRKIQKWGASWKSQLLFSTLGEIICLPGPSLSSDDVGRALRKYERLVSYIREQRLLDVTSIVPLLSARDIRHLFDIEKGDKAIAKAAELLFKWQLEHPDEGRSAAEAWLLAQKEVLGVSSN